MAKIKHQFGQYMTPSLVADFMVNLISHNKNATILEPSCGDGAFLLSLKNQNFTSVTACEIDNKIVNPNFPVEITSFINFPLSKKFDVIIGNPPYIRWKNLEQNLKSELLNCDLWNKYCNSLCDYSTIFIIKAIEHLNDDGELIFITPEYWLSTTHAQNLRDFILEKGSLSHIFRFNETKIFSGVTSSFIIFRFVKNHKNQQIQITNCDYKKKLTEKILNDIKNKQNVDVFTIPQFQKNSIWILANSQTQNTINSFEQKCTIKNKKNFENLGDYCSIGSGMVSGLDKAFQLSNNSENLNHLEKENLIKVIKAKDINAFFPSQTVDYIFIKDNISQSQFKNIFPNFYNQLVKFQEKLENRYNYNHPLNFWEWAFLRNFNLFASSQDKIFVPCKERITKKNRFRFCYAQNDVFPTQDVVAIYKNPKTTEDLLYILAFLNTSQVFTWLCHKGIRKGDIIEFSQTPIASIPFRKIDFTNPSEVQIHNTIVNATKKYISSLSSKYLATIETEFSKLL